MRQYKVVAGLTETLGHLLKTACKDAGFARVDISHEVPKSENIKSKPCISCYQYHLSFAPHYPERNQTLVTENDEQGKVVTYYKDAPLYLFAHYMVCVFGNSAKEEGLLMGLAMKTFLEHPLLTGAELKGEGFYPDDQIILYPHLQTEYEDVMSFWRSMNEEVRPVAMYQTKFRIESDRVSVPIRPVDQVTTTGGARTPGNPRG